MSDQDDEREERDAMITGSSRPMRRLNPLGMRVVVKIREAESITEGGLYVPESARSKMAASVLAEVLEVASAIDHDTQEEANISGIPLGALVLIGRNVGTQIPWDDSIRIVETKDVLATVEETPLS